MCQRYRQTDRQTNVFLSVTLPNDDRFSHFFTDGLSSKFGTIFTELTEQNLVAIGTVLLIICAD